MNPTIEKTTRYSRFKRVKGNRAVSPNHLARLKRSITHKNLLHLNPIIVNERMEVIDGQHRLTVCEALKLPVYYVVGEGLDFADVVFMNSNVKDWALSDYMDSYCEQGKKDYITARNFAKKWGLSPSNAIAILMMHNTVSRAGLTTFKQGLFEIENLEASDLFASRLRELVPYCTRNTWKDRDFIRALSIAYDKEIDADRLLENVKISKQPLHRRGNVTDYLRQFEDIYNLNLQYRVRLY